MKIELRPTTEQDLPLLLAWRHNERAMRYFEDGFETWDRHRCWFDTLKEKRRESFMVVLQRRPVGEIHVKWQGDVPDIGLYIGDITLWGQGIGKEAVKELLAELSKRKYRGKVTAAIHPENRRSRNLFLSLGFQFRNVEVNSFVIYERSID